MDSSRLFFGPSTYHANLLFLGNNNHVFRGPSSTMISMEDNLVKKRPFFTSPDELIYDEEYYDDQLPEKKRRLTQEQVLLLEKSFEEENKLEPERKSELAKKLGLQPRQVAVWFQNRRARSKNKQLERDYDLLKASYDSLLSNYDSIVKENEKLKSEVHTLNEKLQVKELNEPSLRSHPTQVLLSVDGLPISSQRQLSKAEDRLSSGTGASSVVNEDNPQVVDSGDSYFDCLPPPPPCITAIHSEDDDISDDGDPSYFSSMFTMTANHEHHQGQQEEEGHDLGWWPVWS